MNSLSMFESEVHPLLAYLHSVSQGYYVPAGVEIKIIEPDFDFKIVLPNEKCVIIVSYDQVKVSRIDREYAFIKERESVYSIKDIESAKLMTGLLSGISYEFGCKTYKDADAVVKLVYHHIYLNLNISIAV